jgi:glycosyltransferase involved in cell wall biosynthesis
MKTIDLVLPVYNEEEGIAAFNAALFKVLDTLRDRYHFHVIYVVDRCGDNSFAILKALAAQFLQITVLHLSRRFGHQMSLVAGIDTSRGDAVIMMDCDLEHPLELIPLLLERYEQGFEVVHALRRYGPGVGWSKRSLSKLFYTIQNWLSPVKIHDGAADFRLISRKVALVFQRSIREQNQFLRGLFHWVGFRSTTIDFVSKPRRTGITKYDFPRLLAFSIHGILAFSKIPLRLASLIGLVMACLSMLYSLWLVFIFFRIGNLPPGYTSLIVAVLFLGGLHFMVLGVIGEYLGSLFDEAKSRPLYLIDEIVEGVGR